MESFEIIKSNKETDFLTCDGYQFQKEKSRLNSNNSEITYWRCVESKGLKFKARGKTQKGDNGYELLNIAKAIDHNHLASATKLEVKRLNFSLKERSLQTSEKSSKIIQTLITDISVQTQPYIPSEKAMKKIVSFQHITKMMNK